MPGNCPKARTSANPPVGGCGAPWRTAAFHAPPGSGTVDGMTVTQERPATTIVVGAGPGIGASVARRFSAAGGTVGLVARSADRLRRLATTLEADGVGVDWEAADATDPGALRPALARLAERLGPVDVLCFCPLPDVRLIRPVLGTSAEELLAALALNVGGAAAAVGAVVPAMVERRRGSLLFTTGSGAIRPSPDRAASAVAIAAETAYVDLLHRELTPVGIRVAQVVIVGPVGPGQKHEPDSVANVLWGVHTSPGPAVTVLDHPDSNGSTS